MAHAEEIMPLRAASSRSGSVAGTGTETTGTGPSFDVLKDVGVLRGRRTEDAGRSGDGDEDGEGDGSGISGDGRAGGASSRDGGGRSVVKAESVDVVGGGGGGPHGKTKRSRVHFSCTECHRRKQKCNRETPCQHCIARKIPERCRTFQPGDDPNDLGTRLARVERILDEAFPHIAGRLGSAEPSSMPQTPHNSYLYRPYSVSSQPGGPRTSPSGRSRQQGRSGMERARSSGDSSEEGTEGSSALRNVNCARLSPKGSFFGTSAVANVAPNRILESLPGDTPTLAYGEVRQEENTIDRLMADFGLAPGKQAAIVSELPAREACDLLLDHYFADINWMRQPLPQKTIRRKYEALWSDPSGRPTLRVDNLNFFALLTSLLAVSALSTEGVYRDQAACRAAARRLYFTGQRTLLLSSVIGQEDLDKVIALMMASRFLVLDKRLSESWSCLGQSVRTAQAIGLYRDGEKLGLSPEETEARRRIFSLLLHQDRLVALILGRPFAIDDRYCDVLPPNEEDTEDIFPLPSFPPLPGFSAPSILTIVKVRRVLSFIIGKIVDCFQSTTPTHYNDVLQLEDELQQWRASLPAFFRFPNADMSMDQHFHFLPCQRYLLETEWYFVRITLHRPYLLRSGTSDRYRPSHVACVDSAKRDLLARQAFLNDLEHMPKGYTTHVGSYRTFNSTMVLGIALVLDPHGPDAADLRSHLENFIRIRRAKEMDEMTERDVRIMELFISKADNILSQRRLPPLKRLRDGQESSSRPAKSPRPDDEVQDAGAAAGLLLGLGQSGRSILNPPYPQHSYSSSTTFSTHVPPHTGSSLSSSPVASIVTAPSHARTTSYPQQLYPMASPVGWSPGAGNGNGTTPSTGNEIDESAQSLFDQWYKADVATGGVYEAAPGVNIMMGGAPDPAFLSQASGMGFFGPSTGPASVPPVATAGQGALAASQFDPAFWDALIEKIAAEV